MAHPDLLLEHIDFCKKSYNFLSIDEEKWENILTIIKKEEQIRIITIPEIEDPNHPNLKEIFSLPEQDKNVAGGENSFSYLLGELIDNVYQHSAFEYANVTLRQFSNKIDIIFFDYGTTIKDNFYGTGFIFRQDSEAIQYATGGLSSKPGLDRGQGLQSSIRIVLGFGGEILISSGSGSLYLSNDVKIRYNLPHHVPGTLIVIRAPYPSKEVDIYNYI